MPALGWARLRRVPSLRRHSVGPRRTDIHVLTALSPHPCGSTHSASSAFGLHPSRDRCRLNFMGTKITSGSQADHERIKSFPAKAGPTNKSRALVGPALAGMPLIFVIVPKLHVVTQRQTLCVFRMTCIRLESTQSVPGCIPTRSLGTISELNAHTPFSGTGSSREAVDLRLILIFKHIKPRRHLSRLGCRLNAGFAQWAEPQGCGESAVRTWMSVRRGPTEQDRSEGTLTKEGPNQEQAPLVTWGAFPSNSPKAK